jgi:hypothetical protein
VSYQVKIQQKGGRKSRVANVGVRYAQVEIGGPKQRGKTEKEQLGLKLEYLFGSNRRQTVFNIKEGEHDLDYIYNQRNIYNGTLINGYLNP